MRQIWLICAILFFTFTMSQGAENPEAIIPIVTGFLMEGSNGSEQNNKFEFIVFGDFNQGGCDRNIRVSELISLMSANENDTAAFYVSTGDMIDGYQLSTGNLSFATDLDNSGCGADSSNGNMHKMLAPIKERQPFNGLNASFYPVIGNHDGGWGSGWYPDPWGGGICDMLTPDTPMDFVNHNVSDMSGGYLAATPGNRTTINSLFCNKEDRNSSLYPQEFYYSFAYKNAYFIVLSIYNDYQSVNDRQIAFLEQELSYAQSENKHIFVFAHAPLYTTNYERHHATENWRVYAELFDEYGVDMFFNGHNHCYERSYALKTDPNDEEAYVRDDNGTVYLTVGSAGGGSDGSPDLSNPLTEVTVHIPEWVQVRRWSKYAFAREITVYLKVSVDGDQVSFEATNIGLDSLDSINDGGMLIPEEQIVLGPRVVDTGFLRKYQE